MSPWSVWKRVSHSWTPLQFIWKGVRGEYFDFSKKSNTLWREFQNICWLWDIIIQSPIVISSDVRLQSNLPHQPIGRYRSNRHNVHNYLTVVENHFPYFIRRQYLSGPRERSPSRKNLVVGEPQLGAAAQVSPVRSAMTGPHHGGAIFLIVATSRPGKFMTRCRGTGKDNECDMLAGNERHMWENRKGRGKRLWYAKEK